MTKLDTSGKFAQLVIKELGDSIVDRTVQENIQKVAILLFP